MQRDYSLVPIAPALLPRLGGTMLVLYEAGRTEEHIEYISRTDAENDAIRWMNGENPPFTNKSTGSDSGINTPSLVPSPRPAKPPSM